MKCVGRDSTQDIGVHIDRRKSRNEIFREVGVVKPRDRNVFGHPKSAGGKCLDQAHGGQVIHGHHSRGPGAELKNGHARGVASVQTLITYNNRP